MHVVRLPAKAKQQERTRSPDPKAAIAIAGRVKCPGIYHEFGGQHVGPVTTPGEGPQAIASVNGVEERGGVIKMVSDAEIEVAPIVITAPEVKQWH
jgi:hypothetical protein